jgi:hypothetical protein
VASYPSELSPPQQLYCVSFAFESRSVRLFTLGKPRMCKLAGALVDRPVQFTAALALSPLLAGMSTCRAVLASEGCLADFDPGSPDLRALVRCEVRCARPAFLPIVRPMLPWALPFEGLLIPPGSRCPPALTWRRSAGRQRTEVCCACGTVTLPLRRAEARLAGKPAGTARGRAPRPTTVT